MGSVENDFYNVLADFIVLIEHPNGFVPDIIRKQDGKTINFIRIHRRTKRRPSDSCSSSDKPYVWLRLNVSVFDIDKTRVELLRIGPKNGDTIFERLDLMDPKFFDEFQRIIEKSWAEAKEKYYGV